MLSREVSVRLVSSGDVKIGDGLRVRTRIERDVVRRR